MQPGPAQPSPQPPVLHPIAHIPVYAEPDGSMSYPDIQFDTAQSRIVLVQPIQRPGLWGWVSWHAPTLAGSALLITLAALVWILRRHLKRPQTFGQYYCVRCNYDLTAPGGMPPDALLKSTPGRCPECGVDLLRRRPHLARSLGARLWKPVLAAIALLIGCVTVMWTTLEPYTPAMGQSAWLPFLDVVPGFPRLQRHHEWGRPEELLVTWHDLPHGKHAVLSIPKSNYGPVALSPDARWLTVMNYPEGTRPQETLIYDLAQGTPSPRLVTSFAPSAVQVSPLTHSQDGQRLFVEIMLQPPPIPNATPPAAFDTLLCEVALATGEPRQIASVRVPYIVTPTSSQAPQHQFAVRDQGGGVHWALLIDEGRGAGPSGPTVKTRIITDTRSEWPLEFTGTSWYPPEISADGTSLDIFAFAGGGVAPTSAHLRLSDGAVTQTPALRGAMMTSTAPGKLSLSVAGAAAGISSGTLEVRATDGSLLATLDYGAPSGPPVPGAGVWPAAPRVSPDGRWAAVFVTRDTKSVLWGLGVEGQVLVWDLSAITSGK